MQLSISNCIFLILLFNLAILINSLANAKIKNLFNLISNFFFLLFSLFINFNKVFFSNRSQLDFRKKIFLLL